MPILARPIIRMTNSSLAASSRLSTVSRHLSTSPMSSAQHDKQDPTEQSILFESTGGARVYKLNRPKALNSLNHEMISSLAEKIKTWRESEKCQVIIGRGDDRAFCAGGDVKQLVLDLKANKQTALPFFKEEFELNWLMGRIGKPYVSFIDGIIMGGGAGISMPAHVRVATSRTHFAMPETNIGYSPDVGVMYYLAQLDGAVGAWLAITGQHIFGRAAYELGLATHYVTPNSIPDIIRQISEHPTPDTRNISGLISSYAPPPSSATNSKSNPDGSTVITGEIRRFLDATFSKSSLTEVYKALEQGETHESADVQSWAKEQKAVLDAKSPLGMAVALSAFKKAREAKRLDRTLLNDMAMATAFAGDNRATDDFITGVSAVLVDRIKTRPEWNPSSITDSALSPKNIENNFYNPSSKYLKSMPKLDFKPTSSLTEGKDTTWGKFREFGLPSEQKLRDMVEGSAPGSGAFALKPEELIDRVLEGHAAERRQEFTKRVQDVVATHCDRDEEGYLRWKHDA